MMIVWLTILILYGAINGWEDIHQLHWWLLVPLFGQDSYDMKRKKHSNSD